MHGTALLASTAAVASPAVAASTEDEVGDEFASPTSTESVDPIFAAIEAHRVAVRAHSEAVSREGAAEETPNSQPRRELINKVEARIEAAWAAGGGGNEEDKALQQILANMMEKDGSRFGPNVYYRLAALSIAREARPELFADWDAADNPQLTAARQRTSEASQAMDQSAVDLIDTTPTTLAGVVALLTYAVEHQDEEEGCGFPEHVEYEDGERESNFHCLVHRCAIDALTEIAGAAQRSGAAA